MTEEYAQRLAAAATECFANGRRAGLEEAAKLVEVAAQGFASPLARASGFPAWAAKEVLDESAKAIRALAAKETP